MRVGTRRRVHRIVRTHRAERLSEFERVRRRCRDGRMRSSADLHRSAALQSSHIRISRVELMSDRVGDACVESADA